MTPLVAVASLLDLVVEAHFQEMMVLHWVSLATYQTPNLKQETSNNPTLTGRLSIDIISYETLNMIAGADW